MNRFLIPALAALAGIASMAVLFPKFDPAGSVGQTMDRELAIRKARQIASQNGIDTSNWQAAVINLADAQEGPVKTEVALYADRARHVEVIFHPDGTLDSWLPLGVAAPPVAPETQAPKTKTRRVWSSKTNSNVTFSTVEDTTPEQKANYLFVRLIPTFWYMAAIFYFPVAALRRKLHLRMPLILMGAQIVWGGATFWASSGYQKVLIGRLSEDRNMVGLALSNARPAEAWAFLWLLVFAAVGFSIRTAGNREKWASLELMSQGTFFNRAVGGSIAAGLMAGVAIAAIPYVVAATGIFHGATMALRGLDVLMAPSPNATVWKLSAGVAALGLFGYLYPLVGKLRNRYFRWGVFAPLGIAIVASMVSPAPFATPGANLTAAVLAFAGYTLLFLKWDVLAAACAMMGAQTTVATFVLLVQPGGAVRTLAVPLVLVAAGIVAVSLNAAIRGREGAEAIPEPLSAHETAADVSESGRVRLQAEFDVARKAQEEALPSGPPPLEGYTLAGSCTPAQQVGGDLYEYSRLADGRIAITVADVSGKGVPAALYMMVTKGLLAAATRDSDDLGYILDQTNQHLYRACKKKVFVTMAVVALDPAARRLQHGRAGHNPTIWRRTGRGETVFLKPPGLGLGMTAGERFSRSLRIEELQLEPGDAVVLYSDGVTEAIDSKMEQYGEDRLLRAVEKTDGLPAEESRAAILSDLAGFVGSTPARDDVTLVVLRVAGFAGN